MRVRAVASELTYFPLRPTRPTPQDRARITVTPLHLTLVIARSFQDAPFFLELRTIGIDCK